MVQASRHPDPSMKALATISPSEPSGKGGSRAWRSSSQARQTSVSWSTDGSIDGRPHFRQTLMASEPPSGPGS